MPETKQTQAVGVVRVAVSIIVPEMPESMLLDFRQKVKEVLSEYTGVVFELRMSEPLEVRVR